MTSSALRALYALLILAFVASGCDSNDPDDPPPPPPATTGTVSGTIGLVPGSPGSVSNTRVALFASVDDWAADRVVYQTAADGSGNYTIANVVPGTYYMDAWKDNDGSGTITGPDLFAVWGTVTTSGANLTPIPVAAGATQTVSFTIRQAGGPALTTKPVEMTVSAD